MITAMADCLKQNGLKGFTAGYLAVQYRQAAWTAGYFSSIKFFESKVEEAFKLIYGKV